MNRVGSTGCRLLPIIGETQEADVVRLARTVLVGFPMEMGMPTGQW